VLQGVEEGGDVYCFHVGFVAQHQATELTKHGSLRYLLCHEIHNDLLVRLLLLLLLGL
jgi:hypothetical protein